MSSDTRTHHHIIKTVMMSSDTRTSDSRMYIKIQFIPFGKFCTGQVKFSGQKLNFFGRVTEPSKKPARLYPGIKNACTTVLAAGSAKTVFINTMARSWCGLGLPFYSIEKFYFDIDFDMAYEATHFNGPRATFLRETHREVPEEEGLLTSNE